MHSDARKSRLAHGANVVVIANYLDSFMSMPEQDYTVFLEAGDSGSR